MAQNLGPLLIFLVSLIASKTEGKRKKSLIFLVCWFIYSLLIFYQVTQGSVERGAIMRRLMLLMIPIALMIGQGVDFMIKKISFPSWGGTLTYASLSSIFWGYTWFVKLDMSEWWLSKLELLKKDFLLAKTNELLLWAIPWLCLILLSFINQKTRISSRKASYLLFIVFLLISHIFPFMILAQVSGFPQTWDPAYYNQAASVTNYSNFEMANIILYFDSELSDRSEVTVSFASGPINYYLQSVIRMDHPRNWITYLPLLQNLSKTELLSYLNDLNIRYFLIPNEPYPKRSRYERTLGTSTLFNLIESSEVFETSDGKYMKIRKLADFRLLDLYVLETIP
jgi:hypothetical protein